MIRTAIVLLLAMTAVALAESGNPAINARTIDGRLCVPAPNGGYDCAPAGENCDTQSAWCDSHGWGPGYGRGIGRGMDRNK